MKSSSMSAHKLITSGALIKLPWPFCRGNATMNVTS